MVKSDLETEVNASPLASPPLGDILKQAGREVGRCLIPGRGQTYIWDALGNPEYARQPVSPVLKVSTMLALTGAQIVVYSAIVNDACALAEKYFF
jgi:hypothetical protein